jgi:hypothetical protein
MSFNFKKEWFQPLEKPLDTKNFVLDEIIVSSNGKTLTFKSIADYDKYLEEQFAKALENESKGFITVKISGIAQLNQNSNV